MSRLNFFAKFSFFERCIFVAVAIALSLGVTLLFNENLSERLLNRADSAHQGPLVGSVTYAKNEVRYRQAERVDWKDAGKKQKIYFSDAVFVGEKSEAQVLLNANGRMDIGENSLVVFNKIGERNTLELGIGNFAVEVDGTVTLSMRDEVIQISGQTKLQIFVDKDRKKKPILRGLRGNATIQQRGQITHLHPDEVVAVTSPARTLASATPPGPAAPTVLAAPLFQPAGEISRQNYVWKLYDLYNLKNGSLVPKDFPVTSVHLSHEISWPQVVPTRATSIQVSSTSDFTLGQSIRTTSDSKLRLPEVFIGNNYWRASFDQRNWSDVQQFQVIPQFLPDRPTLKSPFSDLVMVASQASIELAFESGNDVGGHIVEVSPSAQFPANQTQTLWTGARKAQIPVSELGDVYLRARRVLTNQELSEVSETLKIRVFLPTHLARSKVPERSAFVSRKEPAQPPPSTAQKQTVAKSPLQTQKSAEPRRRPAEVKSQVQTKVEKPPEPFNLSFTKDRFDLTAGSFVLQSNDQDDQGSAAPSNAVMGLRYLGWFGVHGLSADFQSKVSSLNNPGKDESPTRLGVDYLRRWELGSTRFSAGIGYEVYRNAGTTLFSSKYDVFRAIMGLEMPLKTNWVAGVNMSVGYGTDLSKKYEASTHIDYYWNRRWSFGVGYQLRFFDAGSTAATPSVLPYREVSEDTASVLGYHF